MSGPQSALQIHWEVLTFFSCSVKEIRTCFSCHTSRFGISVQIPTSTRLLWLFMIILRMCLKWGSSTARGRCWDPNLLGRCSQLSTHHPLFFLPVSCMANASFRHTNPAFLQDHNLCHVTLGPGTSTDFLLNGEGMTQSFSSLLKHPLFTGKADFFHTRLPGPLGQSPCPSTTGRTLRGSGFCRRLFPGTSNLTWSSQLTP